MSVREAHPELIPDDGMLVAAHELLVDAYRDYVRNVSPPQMAISYETACYVAVLCWSRNPSRVMDYGSGFTSFVLRAANPDAEVISVDDSPEWLGWSRAFSERHNVKDGDWYLWPEQPVGQFDLIVYDFASGDLRNEHFATAVHKLAPGGLIVFDDAQHSAHHAHMRHACEVRRLDLFKLEEWTCDQFYRYAAVGVHTEASL